jgi:hypothetical protein
MKFCKHVLYLQRYFLNHFRCHRCLEKLGVRTISMNYVLVFEVKNLLGKKNSANFEHYDLRDDNELDPKIW